MFNLLASMFGYRKCENCENYTKYQGGRAKIPCCSSDCWCELGG